VVHKAEEEKEKTRLSKRTEAETEKEEIAAHPANRAAVLYLLSFGNSFSLSPCVTFGKIERIAKVDSFP
jgi:hypothetical protein